MMNSVMRGRRRLLLGASVLFGAGLALHAPSASAAVEYVKICSLYGASFAYEPGTDKCMDTSPLEYRVQTTFGTMTNYIQNDDQNNLVYGTNGYAGGTSSSAFGDGAYAGGNPNGTDGGLIDRSIYPSSRFPFSDFLNSGATAVGQGAEAGASAAGQTNATAVGQGATANVANGTAIGQGAVASGVSSTALGQGATASADSSVAIGQGSVADQANTVSFGAPGAERRLVNVAAGVMGTDAVNVDQLNAAMATVVSQTGSTLGGNSKGLSGPSAGGDEAFAGGYGATAGGQGSVAIGQGANASAGGAVAVGAGASAAIGFEF